MTIDKAELRRLAKEAGAQIEQWSTVPKLDSLFHMTPEQLEKFAVLLLDAKEREIEGLREREEFLKTMTRDAQDFASLYGEEMLGLRADALRYRHIKPMARVFGLNIDGQHSYTMMGAFARLKGPNLDAAIDAAIASEQEKGK